MASCSLLYSFALTLTLTYAYPTNVGPHETKKISTEIPQAQSPEQAGYPDLLTRKTSRLLSEALHMLSRVKDVHERRWLESFVHRLALLADELDKSSEGGKKGNRTAKDLVEFSKSLVENADQLKDFVSRAEMGNLPKSFPERGSSPQKDEDDLVSQLKSEPKKEDKLLTNKTPKTSVQEEHESEMAAHRANKLRLEKLKEAEKRKILKEIFALSQKLKELGGETKAAVDVIKRSRGGVQIGTGHHFWDGAHHATGESSTPTPSGGQLVAGQVVKSTASAVTKRSKVEDSESDESEEMTQDDLVKQLEDEKFILVTDPSRSKGQI